MAMKKKARSREVTLANLDVVKRRLDALEKNVKMILQIVKTTEIRTNPLEKSNDTLQSKD